MTDTWEHPFSFAAVSIFTIIFSSVLVIILSFATSGEPVTHYLVNAFGFFVGMVGIFLAFYTQFGPRINLPLMPRGRVPARVPSMLFTVGAATCLTALRWLVDTDLLTLFFRVIGYSIFFAAFVGIAVSYIVRCAPGDSDAPTKSIDDAIQLEAKDEDE